MSLLLLFHENPAVPNSLDIRCTNIRLVSGHVYKLSLQMYSTIDQDIQIRVQNSGLSTTSLSQTKYFPANTRKAVGFEFTAGATDIASVLRITPTASAQTLYIDKVKLIDLTLYRHQYRVMRIQGSVFPGSFIQTLTLREKTAQETA